MVSGEWWVVGGGWWVVGGGWWVVGGGWWVGGHDPQTTPLKPNKQGNFTT